MKRRWRWILLLCLILMIPVSASANSPAPGPNYDFSLELVNAPSRPYIVGILTREPGAKQIELVKHIKPEQREMLAALFSLEAEGWHPVTEVPTGGLFQANGTAQIEWMTITQSMKEYRIILITESGTIHVSDPVTHRDYANRATYDLETNQLTQHIDYQDYGRRVLIAVLVTLIVETLVLKLFGFPVKQNLRVIVLTNLSTQLLLNVVLFVTHYYEFTQDNASVLLLMELVIPIIEAVAYAKFLQGRTVKRRVLYAFIANFTSFAIGMLIYNAYTAILFLFYSPMIIVYWFNCLFDPAY